MPLCGPDGSVLGNYVVVANLAALPGAGTRYPGMRAYQADTQQVKEWDGSGWIIMSEPAQAWTPAWGGGVTAGNGAWSLTGYHRSDGWLDFQGKFTLGTTSAVTGTPNLILPVAGQSTGNGQIQAEFLDASGGAVIMGYVDTGNTTSVNLLAQTAGGTFVGLSAINATTPFTWAASDTIRVAGRYRMSTRYL